MARQKTLFIIDKKRGVIRGNFHEFKGDSSKPLRKDLCSFEEAEYKQTARGKKKRNEQEKANYLLQLYEQKKKDLSEQSLKKEKEKDRTKMISFLFEAWLGYIEKQVIGGVKNKDTLRKYKNTRDFYLEANIDHSADEFSHEKINFFFEYLHSKGNSRRSIWNQSINLKTCFNWLLEEELIEKEFKFRNPKKPSTIQPSLSNDNVEALESEARKLYFKEVDPHKKKSCLNRLRAIVLARYTGFRGAEIWSLKLKDIDTALNKVFVRKKTVVVNTRAGFKELEWIPKMYEEREVELSKKLLDFLNQDFKERGPKEVYYLDDGGGKLSLSDAGKLTRLVRKISKEGTKPLHSIRSQVITKLLDSGSPVEQVQKFAGHKDRQTTWGYYQSSRKGQKEMVDVL